MLAKYQSFHSNKKIIKMNNPNFNYLLQTFSYYLYSQNKFQDSDNEINSLKYILQDDIANEIIICDNYQEENEKYLLLCFNYLILIIEESCLDDFITKVHSNIYQLSDNLKKIIINIRNSPQNYVDRTKNQLLNKFIRNISINQCNKDTNAFWNIIIPIISEYLIRKAYFLSKINRSVNSKQLFDFKSPCFHLENDKYIDLCPISQGSSATVNKIYHIKMEQIFVLKLPFDQVELKSFKREEDNFKKLQHPFLPRYYGTAKMLNCFGSVIEYINGQTLYDYIVKNKLKDEEKLKIIFEISITLNFLHSNGFLYRDLKPNNIIIDTNGTAVLIDFDKMIYIDTYDKTKTIDFASPYAAPEICDNSPFTYKSDIFSLGKVIYFIFTGKDPKRGANTEKISNNANIQELCDVFTYENPAKRPEMFNIVNLLFKSFYNLIISAYSKDIKKAIELFKCLADHNDPFTQLFLGQMYYDGKYIKRNINEAIHYFKLAANQKIYNAQIFLGMIYYENKYIERDFNKSFHYFKLAAKFNHPSAFYHIGLFYYEGIYVKRDIQEAITNLEKATHFNMSEAQFLLGQIFLMKNEIDISLYYLNLSAKQNNPRAHNSLGYIYYLYPKYKDIAKSIQHLNIGASFNNLDSMFLLGQIYFEGKYVKKNIDKSIKYLSQAAKQNHAPSQMYLSLVYQHEQYLSQNEKKSNFYLDQSLEQKNSFPILPGPNPLMESLYNSFSPDTIEKVNFYMKYPNYSQSASLIMLGYQYLEGNTRPKDIDKAIECFKKAADEGFPLAQFILGTIYLESLYVAHDIPKSIYYFTLAADQGLSDAHFYLGFIYLNKEFKSINVEKGFYHFNIASELNNKNAHYYLGCHYYYGEYIERNIYKAIHYFYLASQQEYADADFHLGLIYYEGKFVRPKINDSIYFFKKAARENSSMAQFYLGLIYYEGEKVERDIKESILNFQKSAENYNNDSQFILGVIYSENKYILRNIDMSIHYYKDASSMNNAYAKNNLGIIYKNGYCGIKKNIQYAIELFQESMRLNNNPLAIYNLAHIYLFEQRSNIDKSIDLLLEAYKNKYSFAEELLCLALPQKLRSFLPNQIMLELERYANSGLPNKVIEYTKKHLANMIKFKKIFEHFRGMDYMYDIKKKIIRSSIFYSKELELKENRQNKIKNINNLFYDGLGNIFW